VPSWHVCFKLLSGFAAAQAYCLDGVHLVSTIVYSLLSGILLTLPLVLCVVMDADGRTALMLACVRGHRDVVSLLLSAGNLL